MPRTKEQNAEYCRRYVSKNREKVLTYSRNWHKKDYLENREKKIQENKHYRDLEKINNPEQRMARSRRNDKNKLSENEQLLESMAGRPRPVSCEVCGGRSPRPQGQREIVFDHNHATGKFRGWLCNPCNVILGFAKDNPKVLHQLGDYLTSDGIGFGQSTEEVSEAIKYLDHSEISQ